jgi:hypothetical protein
MMNIENTNGGALCEFIISILRINSKNGGFKPDITPEGRMIFLAYIKPTFQGDL